MIRGTTPTHIFETSLDTSLIQKVKIIYSQDDKVILEKKTDDCEILPGMIKTKLTQEDTFKFDCTKYVYVQIRVLTLGNEAIASCPILVDAGKCLDEEVLV